mmetsp:Transcript_92545/g.215040  ORF Transcript_92545/g.215040 Transcript_92545/m.215040 type:complete len:224 (+) Transcript_92545:583-1254(+)
MARQLLHHVALCRPASSAGKAEAWSFPELCVGLVNGPLVDVMSDQQAVLLAHPRPGDVPGFLLRGEPKPVKYEGDRPDGVSAGRGDLACAPHPPKHVAAEEHNKVLGVGADHLEEPGQVVQMVRIQKDPARGVALHEHLDLPGKCTSAGLVMAKERAVPLCSPEAAVRGCTEEQQSNEQHKHDTECYVPSDGLPGPVQTMTAQVHNGGNSHHSHDKQKVHDHG